MTKDNTAGSEPNLLPETVERWHRSRFGSSVYSEEVYGYWIFAIGTSLVIIGFLIFILSSVLGKGDTNLWVARQTAAVLAASGAPAVLYATVRELPVRHVHRGALATGAFLCSVAVVLFVFYYPTNWNVLSRSPSPDSSGWVSAVYFLGIIFLVLPALVRVWTEGFHRSNPDRRVKQLVHKVDRLEKKLESQSSTVNEISKENRRIRSTVDEIENRLRTVSEQHERSMREDVSERYRGED
jgi:hypothetical protein